MRQLTIRFIAGVALVLGFGLTAMAAKPRPSWYPADEAVEKQLALRNAKQQATEAYYRRVIRGQYDAVGHHSPAWDDAAHRLIAANIVQRSNPHDPPADAAMARWLTANECARARCTDPFIVYMIARTSVGTKIDPERLRTRTINATKGLLSSEYQGMMRYYAHIYLAGAVGARTAGGNPDMVEAGRSLQAALELLPKLLSEPDLPDAEIHGLLNSAAEVSLSIYGDRWQWTKEVYSILEKQLPQRSAVYAAKGALFVKYAWDARGSGWAASVTDEGWRKMAERLAIAETACEKAWAIDNQCLEAAVTMLTVELGQGKGIDVLDRWFERAVAIDPFQYRVYSPKLLYLAAKWHGSDAQAMSFAREVAATLPADCAARLVVVQAHLDAASRLIKRDDVPKPGEMTELQMQAEEAYYRQNPEAYAEVAGIYKDLIASGKARATQRMVFARTAVAAGDAASARDALKGIPDEQTAYFYRGDKARIKAAIE